MRLQCTKANKKTKKEKDITMKKLIAVAMTLLAFNSVALERKDLKDVSNNDIIADTQAQPEAAGDDHMALVWWIPLEYWASVFSRDPSISESIRNDMLNVLDDYVVIGVVQADISRFGSFDFYAKDEILKTIDVSYAPAEKAGFSLPLEENVSGDMQLLMEQIGPILKAAMGNMGANFHFFIYSDRTQDGSRLVDPYKHGELAITFKNRDSQVLDAAFPTPLNSLFIPRVCPNGEEAHVSWNYCPWSGKKL